MLIMDICKMNVFFKSILTFVSLHFLSCHISVELLQRKSGYPNSSKTAVRFGSRHKNYGSFLIFKSLAVRLGFKNLSLLDELTYLKFLGFITYNNSYEL